MALVNMNEMLNKAKKGNYAVPNFDVLSSEMLRGVMEAAQETSSPVILAYPEVFEPLCPMEEFAPMLRAAAARAHVPVAIHLDHARRFEYIQKAVDHGFSSVMLDASDLPLEDNIALTKKVVDFCRPLQVSVESELGHVGGLEGYSYSGHNPEDEAGYTVVSEAVKFVADTKVDALAVAIGTVHGVYTAAPKLNLQRLSELREAVDVPLVMHGGSGLSDDDFRNVIKAGITKTNIFTDLTIAAWQSMQESGLKDYMSRCAAAVSAVREEAIKKIELFSSAHKA
jgi:fructose-bisphosphate aldolase class II